MEKKSSFMEFIREFFHPMTSSFLSLKWTVYLIGLAALPPIQAEDEDTGALQIESTADELSADIHIAREEGKEPPRDEADDRKRTRLGIGESVDLLLTGKDSLIGNAQKIKWTILKGENLGELDEEMGNPVKLKLSPYSVQGGKLVVQATTEHNMVKEIEFTVVVPEADIEGHQKVTAQHAKNPSTGKRGYDEWNFEAFPTDVSFHKVEMLETHLKNIPDPLPEMGSEHKPMPIWSNVNNRNVFIDNIGSPKSMNQCKDLPQEWTWVSKFSTSRMSEPLLDITTQHQRFLFTWSAPNEEGVTVKITKFGRGVQRTAIKMQYYTSKRKPETLTKFL